ncbi:hypothetical protein Tco_0576717 [Tanacetum coccineum]
MGSAEEERIAPERKVDSRVKSMSKRQRVSQEVADSDSEYEKEKEELSLHLKIASNEDKEVDYEILDVRSPIIEWKSVCLGTRPQPDNDKEIEMIDMNVVTRSNGSQRYFTTLMRVLSIFDRQDLLDVYKLVMERYEHDILEGFDRVLWGDLMVIFNPNEEDDFWQTQ